MQYMPGWGSGGGGPPRGCAASRGRAGGEQGLWGKTEESGVPPASPEQLKLADLKLIGCNFTPHSVGPGLGPAESLEQPSPFLKPKKAQAWGRWGHVSTAGLPLGGRWTEVPRAQALGDREGAQYSTGSEGSPAVALPALATAPGPQPPPPLGWVRTTRRGGRCC